MTTYPDWRIPVIELQAAHGAPTAEQLELAAAHDVVVTGAGSQAVLAARLADTLAGALDLVRAEPAGIRQLVYLQVLSVMTGVSSSHPAELSRREASAWIRTLLGWRTLNGLQQLQPCRGDLVVYRPRTTAASETRPDTVAVVSSISETGKINLRRHDGARSIWPSQVVDVVRQPSALAQR